MIWCGRSVPWRRIRRRTAWSVTPPGSWWPTIGTPLILEMSTALPEECSETLPEVVRRPWLPFSDEIDGLRPDSARYSSVASTRRSIWPDLMSSLAARVDLDALVGEDALLEQRLGQEDDLADREAVRLVVAVEDVLAGGAVDGGGLEQLPAVEDRLRIDPRRAAAGGADLEVDVRGLAAFGAADAAEDRAADDLRADLEAAQAHVLGVNAEGAREVVLVGLEAARLLQLGVEQLLEPAGLLARPRRPGARRGVP